MKMKSLKKLALVVLTVLMLFMSVSVLTAEDEETATESASTDAVSETVLEKGDETVLVEPEATEETLVYDDAFYAKIAEVYGEGALEYLHIAEGVVFIPDEAWMNYGSTKGAKNSTEALRASDERHKTARWDDFPGSGYFDNNTSVRYLPGIYLIGPTDAAWEERSKFEVSFCVQPASFQFGSGVSVAYESVSMANYSLLTTATKTKIARIVTQYVKNVGGNTYAALRTDSNNRSVNQKIGEALAVQSAIWRLVEQDSVAQSYVEHQNGFFRMNTNECDNWGDSAGCRVICETQNSLISYYYNTVANTDISGGISVASSYSGYVNQPIKIGTVNNPSNATVTLPSGLVFCDADGNTKSSVQWDGRYFYVKATIPLDGAQCTITVGDPSIHEPVYRANDSLQNVVTSGVLSEKATFKVTAIQMNLSVVKVPEETNFDYLNECPNNYSLAGAVYGVYNDQACTDQIGTLTTGEDGKTEVMNFTEEATYYVKEITASPGYSLDPQVYTAVIISGKDTVITSKEPPLNDPLRFKLIKQNAKDQSRAKYLEDAEFTLRYYDAQIDDVSDLEPKYEWVFHPIYNDDGEAEVRFDQEHYVSGDELILNEDNVFYLPLGTFTIEETKAPQTYLRDETIYVGHITQNGDTATTVINGGDYLTVENENLTQSEREAIRTVATFHDGSKHYPADGIVTVLDTVIYDYLIPGQEYTLVAKLVNKGTEEVVLECNDTFTPETESGKVVVTLGDMDITELENTAYVAYEYLFTKEQVEALEEEDKTLEKLEQVELQEESLTYHEDLEDEDQTVYVDELYSAAFILYKIGDNSRSNKLNGAFFEVNTRRIRRDGTVIEKDLGRYVTGGIFVEDENPFTLYVYSDEGMTQLVKTCESRKHAKFGTQSVTVLDLKDGIYYVTKDSEEKATEYHVSRGTIYLPEQEEDTEITFREVIAPAGYYLETKPFTMTVGHDYGLKTVENYRSNSMIIIPNTGYEGN